MKRRLLPVLLLLVVFQSAFAAEFEKKTFFSAALNREETYFVSLPDGYNAADSTKKFPVIIFLHGASVNAQDIVNIFEPLLAFPLTRTPFQKMFNVILIIPNGAVAPYQGSFYSNSALYGNYEDYISTDLINEIKTNFHTYEQRQKWSIMGHSMGGYGAMKNALKHTDKFIGVAALSGPLHITYYDEILPMLLQEHGNVAPYNFTYEGNVTKLIYSMAGAFSPNITANPPINFPVSTDGTIDQTVLPLWEENNPINMIGSWKGSPSMAIYMYCGGQDNFKLLPQNQLFSDSLTRYNIPHTFDQDPTGDHVNSLSKSFPRGLDFLVGVMDTANTNPTTITNHVINNFKIYPNPANDYIYLSSDQQIEIKEAIITSLSGATIERFVSLNNKRFIPVSQLAPGCYLLSIYCSDGQYRNLRFVKTN